MGRHTSIELIPATEIGTNLPPQRARTGVPNKAIISRMTLASKAIVANSAAPCGPRVFVGLGDFAPEWLLGHDLPIIILSLLIVQVGISLGSNNDLRGLFHSLNPRQTSLGYHFVDVVVGLLLFLFPTVPFERIDTAGYRRDLFRLSLGIELQQLVIVFEQYGLAGRFYRRAQVYKRFFYHRLVFFANVIREMIALFGTPVDRKSVV